MIVFKYINEYLRRFLRNYKIYTISILGMSVAVIASFYIYLFAFKELTVDHFHTHRKDIYRLVNQTDDANFRSTETFVPLGPLLKEQLPQVLDYTRISKIAMDIRREGAFELSAFEVVDPSFFSLFDFGLKHGSALDFANTPNAIVLSEQKAIELFGEENPVGKGMTVVSQYGESPREIHLQITGILKNISASSTIQGDLFLNMQDYYSYRGPGAEDMKWMSQDVELYLYGPHINKEVLSKNITEILLPRIKSESGAYAVDPNDFKAEDYGFDLQRMDHIYFDSTDILNQEKKGDFQFVQILILVGLLTLFMAISNYTVMNLGLNLNRSKEFQVRRCLGASKGNLFSQLMTESVFNALICFLLTFISYPLMGGFIARLIGYDYQLSVPEDLPLLAGFFGIVLLVGIIIGLLEYAFSYTTLFTLKHPGSIRLSGLWTVKKVMIGIQLSLFIALLTCILVVGKQIHFIEHKNLGYNAQNVVSVSIAGYGDELKNELSQKSFVKDVSIGQNIYKPNFKLIETFIEGTQKKVGTMMIIGDAEYLKVHGMKLAYGRNLNPDILPDVNNYFDAERRRSRKFVEVLVNEEFVRKAGLSEPIGTVLTNPMLGIKAHIVGVFKNINNVPVYYPVQPAILGFDLSGYPNLFQISCEPNSKDRLVAELRDFFFQKNLPPFIVDRLVQTYDYKDIYKKEIQLNNLLQAFTIIVMFVALLGMISISLFIAESRTKEIGIRKVNGATVREILTLLNKDYILWIGLAFIFTTPIVWYIMRIWLQHFAYKTALSWWIFTVAGGFVLLSALITVSWHSFRAAMANPVEALRNE